MKFAHMADCHIGSWRDPKMSELGIRSFSKSIEIIIEEKCDFLLISGDLFNTSMPSVDRLKIIVNDLMKLKKEGIKVYIIAGSHDYSPSGKTMLDVLENAGLFFNVGKHSVEDDKIKLNFWNHNGVKITGMLGKKQGLEKTYYENLNREINEDGFKIFMFHSAITELKPKELQDMDSSPASLLPKNFDYYAGGHVHIIREADCEQIGLGKGKIVYPGPLFPNNFKELEELKRGGFYIWKNQLRYVPIEIKKVKNYEIECTKEPSKIEEELMNIEDIQDCVVLFRLKGRVEGKISEINFRKVFQELENKGAYFVMKNTSKLRSKDFEEVSIIEESVEDIEEKTIKEHAGQYMENEEKMARELMKILSEEKKEGERQIDYEERIISSVLKEE